MEKATYSLSALKQCKELIRKNRWSTRLKAEHNSRCAEVNVLFASCQKLLNYVMLTEKLNAILPLCHSIFFQLLATFS